MKQRFTYYMAAIAICASAAFHGSATAQSPDVAPVTGSGGAPPDLSGSRALWDVIFEYNVTDSIGSAGMAGVVFTGTEFWVSRWATDSIYTFDVNGNLLQRFTISGITGIRSMTYDSQTNRIYAGLNTSSVRIIDVATHTQLGTINVPAVAVRWITYDSTANAGAGGFYVGNFATNIFQIDMSGNVLSQIPQTTHGFISMYGAAVDHTTPGGPYLWIFDQGPGGNLGIINQVALPSGVPTGITHNTMDDVTSTQTSNLAGGLTIAPWSSSSTGMAIIGLAQSAPDNILFGYELGAPASLIDVRLDSLVMSTPYFQTPLNHVVPVSFRGYIHNAGTNAVSNVALETTIDTAGVLVYTDSTASAALNAGSGAGITTSSAFTADMIGVYDVTSNAAIFPETDADLTNDTLLLTFAVTDTVFARDNGVATGSIGIGSGGGRMGTVYTPPVNDEVTSITAGFVAPAAGDSTMFEIYSFTTAPGALLATTPSYVFTAADTNGVVITLPVTGGPLAITGNTSYLVVAREFNANLTVATNNQIFHPNTNWAIFSTNPWQPFEFYGFQIQLMIRMNVKGCRSTNMQTVSICEGQSITVGQNTYSTPGVYTDVLSSIGGCDSTVITDLTIDTLNTATTVAGPTITAVAGGLSYQWIDCSDNSQIAGETGQSFTAAVDGDYAVIITGANCSDTSACRTVIISGQENYLQSQLFVYPNPASQFVSVNTGDLVADQIIIMDVTGRILKTIQPAGIQTVLDILSFEKGVYLVQVMHGTERATVRLIRQ